MFEPELVEFLESGCSTIVGLVTVAGEPFATRGWGIHVLPGDEERLRLVVGAGAMAAAGRRVRDGATFAIAVTGADVRTLRSVQLKGTARDLEPVDDDDRARSERFCDAFFGDVEESDAIPRLLMQRLVPADLLACTVDVDAAYDQTPGPGAGGVLAIGQR